MFSKLLSLDTERQDAILNAALKEFSVKGYDEASTNVIAKVSGISKPMMFHYINSKKDFFFFLYDYCTGILENEYLSKINKAERDIFEYLRQSCLLKLPIAHRYPWIFDFVKSAALTYSIAIKNEMEKRRKAIDISYTLSLEELDGDVDTSCIRNDVDAEKAKQLIVWTISGYMNEMLERFRCKEAPAFDPDKIRSEFDGYLNELRKTFCK